MKRILWLVLLSVSLPKFISAQQPSYRLGLRFNDKEYQKVDKRYYFVGKGLLPQAHSLKQYCPKPLSQLNLTTSAGWAVAYCAFTISRARQHDWPKEEITRNASSPIYPYYKAKKEPTLGSLEQVSLVSVLEALKMYGTPDYIGLPSRSISQVSDKEILEASANRLSEYSRLYNIHDPKSIKIKAIKTSLSENMAVVAAMHIPKSFFYAREFWAPREIFRKDLPGHAVTIIGYDDNKYGGAFEIQNSWGIDWGNEGFMWIKYDDFIEFTEYALNLYLIPGAKSTELAGSIELTLLDNKSIIEVKAMSPGYYKIKESYPAGTEFMMKVNNYTPAFVYAFASDLNSEIYSFFPASSVSAAINQAASFFVPDQNTPLIIVETAGTDYLCVLFSKEAIDMDNFFNSLNQRTDDFKSAVAIALRKQLIPSTDIHFGPTKASFKMPFSKQSVVAIIIEHKRK